MPCMRGLAVAISSRFTTPRPVSRIACTRIGRSSPALRLELGEQAVDVVDVPGALDLRDHDHVELVADLGDAASVMSSRTHGLSSELTRVQSAVSPRSISLPTLTRPSRAASLLSTGDRVLEVAEHDVRLRGDVGQLADDLLVRRVEEVDHPRGRERDLEHRVGRADGEGLDEVAGVAQGTGSGGSFAGRRGRGPRRQGMKYTIQRAPLTRESTCPGQATGRPGAQPLRCPHERLKELMAENTVDTDQAPARPPGRTPMAATSRSSRSAPPTSTGPPRP